MIHQLPKLPYPEDALQPFMSRETIEYHYGKHHKGYVDKLNELIKGSVFEDFTLEKLVQSASGPIFNNAAQAWNHSFFWHCVTPDHHKISNHVLHVIERSFKSLDHFQDKFIKMGTEHFGSGYIWLVEDGTKLKLETTRNGDNPLRKGKHAVLTCDLWEHAYYIDYRNERRRYLEAFVEIINWDFVRKNLSVPLKAAA